MEKKKGNGLAIASLVLGIIGLLTSCIFVGSILCIIGLVLGIVSIANGNEKKGLSITGIVLSIIGIIISILVIVFICFSELDSDPATETTETSYKIGSESQKSENKEISGLAVNVSATVGKCELIIDSIEVNDNKTYITITINNNSDVRFILDGGNTNIKQGDTSVDYMCEFQSNDYQTAVDGGYSKTDVLIIEDTIDLTNEFILNLYCWDLGENSGEEIIWNIPKLQ